MWLGLAFCCCFISAAVLMMTGATDLNTSFVRRLSLWGSGRRWSRKPIALTQYRMYSTCFDEKRIRDSLFGSTPDEMTGKSESGRLS